MGARHTWLRKVMVGVAAAVLAGAAAAQPQVSVSALVLGTGLLPAYLVRRVASPATERPPGSHFREGLGLCFEGTVGQQASSFRCFHRILAESGVGAAFDGTRAYTVFAPSDAAFAHLAATLGSARFARLMSSPRAARALARRTVVPGSHTLASLAFDGPRRALVTLAGSPLGIVFGPAAAGAGDRRTVAVGPAAGLDGQAFASGPAVRFPDGSVLVPIDRIPLTAWSGAAAP